MSYGSRLGLSRSYATVNENFASVLYVGMEEKKDVIKERKIGLVELKIEVLRQIESASDEDESNLGILNQKIQYYEDQMTEVEKALLLLCENSTAIVEFISVVTHENDQKTLKNMITKITAGEI